MHFEGVFSASAPIDRVYGAITDPEQVARCIPDLRSLEVKSADEFDAVIGVRVAIVSGEISMHFRTVERKPPSRVKLLGHGAGLGSAMDIEIAIDLEAGAGGETTMRWTADATISGKIASLGQGLLKSQAEKIVRQLFDCLRQKLE